LDALNISILNRYFPNLTARQSEQFAMLGGLYAEWNSRINVISRKDIDHLYERHVLHSLAIGKVIRFAPGARVLDVGTGEIGRAHV
jgi:16S rRNA (guanine527-N7)-methyltransferase